MWNSHGFPTKLIYFAWAVFKIPLTFHLILVGSKGFPVEKIPEVIIDQASCIWYRSHIPMINPIRSLLLMVKNYRWSWTNQALAATQGTQLHPLISPYDWWLNPPKNCKNTGSHPRTHHQPSTGKPLAEKTSSSISMPRNFGWASRCHSSPSSTCNRWEPATDFIITSWVTSPLWWPITMFHG